MAHQEKIKEKAMEGQSFTEFARVYDMYMDGIPYDEWYVYLVSLLEEYGVGKGALVADLGCGTGNMTERLAAGGYDVIGLDASEEMLAIAMNKRLANQSNVLYIHQDVTAMELYGTVAAMVSVGDSVNYILEAEGLGGIFRGANNYLDPGGVLVFDLKTDHYFRTVLGAQTFVEQKEEGTLIWENEYFDTKMLHQYDLTIYNRSEGDGRYYERYYERQFQRAYLLDEVVERLEEAGMELVAAYDAFTKNPPREESERVYVVARKRASAR